MNLTVQQKKAIPFQVKADMGQVKAQTDGRTVSIVGNTYNYLDSDYDVLLPGCCAKSIADRGPASNTPGKIKHLSNHNYTVGIGRFDVLDERKVDGNDVLYAESWMSETPDGENTLVKYKEGLIDQHSIGFRYMDLRWLDNESDEWGKTLEKLLNPEDAENAGFLYLVSEVQLYEISSLDGFGANRLTPYLGVKSDNVNVQYNNLIAKLDALTQGLRTGGDKDIIKMQEAQIKQMIYELYNPEPSKDDIAKRQPKSEDTKEITAEQIAKLNINF